MRQSHRLAPASSRQVFFVVGKNYRLQDIQLSKNASEATSCQLSASSQRRPLARQLPSKPDPGAIAPRDFSAVSGRFPPDPLAHSTREAPEPRPFHSPQQLSPSGSLSQARPFEPSSEAGRRARRAVKAGGLCDIPLRGGASGPPPSSKGRRPLQSDQKWRIPGSNR